MKIFIIVLCLSGIAGGAFSQQKAVIDSNAYHNWPSVTGGNITNDGKFVQYRFQEGDYSAHTYFTSINGVSGNWNYTSPQGVFNATFSNDSRYAVFKSPSDSLYIIKLGTTQVEKIPGVKSFQLSDFNGYLSYLLNDNTLIIRKTNGKLIRRFKDIHAYWFADNENAIVLQKKAIDNVEQLQWISLIDGAENEIWKGAVVSNIMMDKKGKMLAFTLKDKDNRNSVFLYKHGEENAALLINGLTKESNANLYISGLSGFSNDGTMLFVRLEQIVRKGKTNPKAADVNIWNYKDFKLQSQQVKDIGNTPSLTGVIHLGDKKLLQLQESENEYLGDYESGGDYCSMEVNNERYNLNIVPRRAYYLVSLRDGSKKSFKYWFHLSPDKKFLVYFDPKHKNFFSYEITTGDVKNITAGIQTDWLALYGRVEDSTISRGIAAWVKGEPSVLIYDRYDVWEIDLTGNNPAKNLTNGYGARHHILFYLSQRQYEDKLVQPDENLLLSAFNLNNKNNGFFNKKINRKGDPELLTMGPYIYELPGNPYVESNGFSPIKATDTDVYLVQRRSAAEAPNFFITKDFKSFKAVTDIHPEKKYNWYTSELHTWRSLDGRTLQGVLYKPENFDPKEKYPVIFNYYERLSDDLNGYRQPEELSHGCNIDIPSYVSGGYLVFRPDIYYTYGDPMQGVKDAIVSAINYVSKIPFVYSTKLGAEGCSFGGIETNYLLTQTRRFKAAVTASGGSDMISYYGSLVGDGTSQQGQFEKGGQYRMGKTIWQAPEKYIKNSPIFQLEKINTPLLIMHTSVDGAVPFPQAVEMFTGLKRMGKKAWLLQYNDGNHGVWGKSGTDFSIRMMQFFDYYLKGKPAPIWMTKGVPAKLKGIETGLEYDTTGAKP